MFAAVVVVDIVNDAGNEAEKRNGLSSRVTPKHTIIFTCTLLLCIYNSFIIPPALSAPSLSFPVSLCLFFFFFLNPPPPSLSQLD